jgi:hypothetical protein
MSSHTQKQYKTYKNDDEAYNHKYFTAKNSFIFIWFNFFEIPFISFIKTVNVSWWDLRRVIT